MATANVRGLNLRYEIVGDDGPLVTLITGGRRGYDEFLPLPRRLPPKASASCCTTGAIPARPTS